MNHKDYVNIPMKENDAGAKTIGEYLEKLLLTLWVEEEGFSGKRPFGNSGWKYDVYSALVSADVVFGKFDEEGYLEDVDSISADRIIVETIRGCFERR